MRNLLLALVTSLLIFISCRDKSFFQGYKLQKCSTQEMENYCYAYLDSLKLKNENSELRPDSTDSTYTYSYCTKDINIRDGCNVTFYFRKKDCSVPKKIFSNKKGTLIIEWND